MPTDASKAQRRKNEQFVSYTRGYEHRLQDYRRNRQTFAYVTLACIVGGLLALGFNFPVLAAAIFVFGLYNGGMSVRFDLMEDVLTEQWYLARLIAEQDETTVDFEERRDELKRQSPDWSPDM